MNRAWLILLGAAVLAPLVTWLPMLAHAVPGLGLPMYFAGARGVAVGIDVWGMHVLWTCILLMIATLAWRYDRLLAVAVALIAWPVFVRGGTMNLTHTLVFAAGVAMLCALRSVPASAHRPIRYVLAASGVFQMGYALGQKWLAVDPLWNPQTFGLSGIRFAVPSGGWYGFAPLVEHPQPLGTLGTVDALGAYAAITTALLPAWLIPLGIATVLTSKSWGALAALVIGLLVRYRAVIFRKHDEGGWHLVAAGSAASVVLIALPLLTKSTESFWARLIIIDFGATVGWLNAKWMGFGLGGWQHVIPFAQQAFTVMPTRELFAEAHSEPLQWFVETGLAGLALLVAWLWMRRAIFTHPTWGAPCAALAVSSLGFFTFHVVPVALLGLVVVGLALASSPGEPAELQPSHAR